MKTIRRAVLALFLAALAAYAAGISWTGRKVIPDRRTGAGPALAVVNGKLLLIYKGEKSGNLYQSDFDGTTWGGETRIPKINTSDTPALLVQGDTLHCIYVGEKNKKLYHSRYRKGRWLPEEEIGGRKSRAGPAIARIGDTIHMVRLGGGSSHLYYETFDGIRWTPEQRLTGFSSRARPVLAVVGETLHLCYLEDKRGSNRVFHAMLKDGRWTQAAQIGTVASDEVPALVVQDGKLLLFQVRGKQLGYAEFDGRTWGPVTELPGQLGRWSPAVVRMGGKEPVLHLVYVDKKKHYLWHSQGYLK